MRNENEGIEADAKRLPLSSFVVCKNEERHIRACLESLTFCDEVVVVDSFSTDKTVEICKEHNVHFIQREWPGYKLQKEFACNQTKHEWVLFMDADEVVSPELKVEIIKLLSDASDPRHQTHVAFQVKRAMFFLGKWWRKGGWYPEKRIRLFRRDSIRWVGRDPHENIEVSGPIGDLEGEIYHYSYDDIPDQIKKLASHAFVRAKADFDAGKRSSLYDLIAKPIARFAKFYLVRKGFLEGYPGFVVAVHESFYTFMKYSRLWELARIEIQRHSEDGKNGS